MITAIYTVLGGLYGVVVTDVIQFGLILIGSTILIIKAIGMSSYEGLAKAVPPEWFDMQPVWQWDYVQHWEMTQGYSLIVLLAFVWVTKGMLLSVGGPQQLYDMQRFLAARSPRDAAKAGMLWGVALTPMFMVAAAVGVIGIMKWGGNLPHPEKLYPVVIGSMLPVGLKGLVLAGLLSAFMANFSATANAGAAYLVRDGYQRLLRPKASDRELVNASRVASGLVALAGIVVGTQATNIDQIFAWIMMVLGTAVLMPNVFRWFWWRFNGWGYAVGTISGVVAAIISVVWFSDVPVYKSFFVFLDDQHRRVGRGLAADAADGNGSAGRLLPPHPSAGILGAGQEESFWPRIPIRRSTRSAATWRVWASSCSACTACTRRRATPARRCGRRSP